jgi:apolipoprotein N-acyltransferase
MFLFLITLISALCISIIAAGYSIIGLATLFAGATLPIIAMGSALEVGKLVAASWLYHNWREDVPKLLKTYLFIAIIILIFITSMGIFGFLSKAHLDQVKPTSSNNIKVSLLNSQISQQQKTIDRSQKTLDQLDKALDVYIEKEFVTRGLKERKKQEEERNLLNTAIRKLV